MAVDNYIERYIENPNSALLPFIESVPFKISIKGSSFTIPTNRTYKYDYDVDCNDDGILETMYQHGNYTYSYDNDGEHTIAIYKTFPHFGNGNNFIDNSKIIDIKQWGKIRWKSMNRSFANAAHLTITANDNPNLTNARGIFSIFKNSGTVGADINTWNISNWDVSKVVNMHGVFSGATNFNQDISNWDVSSATNMRNVFSSATSFNQDISNWDVSSVADMSWMFKVLSYLVLYYFVFIYLLYLNSSHLIFSIGMQ